MLVVSLVGAFVSVVVRVVEQSFAASQLLLSSLPSILHGETFEVVGNSRFVKVFFLRIEADIVVIKVLP